MWNLTPQNVLSETALMFSLCFNVWCQGCSLSRCIHALLWQKDAFQAYLSSLLTSLTSLSFKIPLLSYRVFFFPLFLFFSTETCSPLFWNNELKLSVVHWRDSTTTATPRWIERSASGGAAPGELRAQLAGQRVQFERHYHSYTTAGFLQTHTTHIHIIPVSHKNYS